MKRVKRYFINALIMTCAALFMRLVSVGFNVYISNRIGAEGMGLFSLISSVYGFAVTFATSGINLAVTRLVSESLGRSDTPRVRKTVRCAVFYCLFFGSLAAVAVYTLADLIGSRLLCDVRTVSSLRIFALSLPMISLSSALNGYFTAVRRVYKNAITALTEQWCRIFLISFLLSLFMPRGIEYACIALVLGGALSEVLSSALMTVLWLRDRRRLASVEKVTDTRPVLPKLLGISLPVAFSSYARSALLTVEHSLIPRGLRKGGLSHASSLAEYGRIHSMAFPILLFPSAFLSSFSGLLIPELSEYREKANERQIRYVAERVFQFTLFFSIGVAGIMICFSREICDLVYPSEGVNKYLSVFAPLIPIMYLDGATDAMLKGLGFQVYSMNVNIIDSALSVILVATLIPRYGMAGYIFVLFFAEILNATLSITKLLCETGVKIGIFRWIFLPIACISGAACLVKAATSFVRFSSDVMRICICISACFALYIGLLVMSRALSGEDLSWLKGLLRRDGESHAS